MTYEQYWYGPTWLARAYFKANRLNAERRNEELWLSGLYTCEAVSVAVHNALSKDKVKYMEKPLQIFEPTEEEKQKEIEEQRAAAYEYFKQLGESFKRRQKESKESKVSNG